MPATKFQTVTLRPLTGPLDMRSSVDETAPNAFRWKLNLAIDPDNSLARALGWTRAFPQICPKNGDFHYQNAGDLRQPPTLMFASTGNDGVRRLFIGTKTRLLVLDEAAGDYTQIGSGLGNDGSTSLTATRFNAAELNNHVVFTNNLDLVQIHVLGTTTVAPIPSLATAGEEGGPITKAKRTVSWNGLQFLLNIEEDGERHANRIRWSDLNDPTWWNVTDNPNTGEQSIADFQDLDPGEEILNAVPLSGSLYVFTDKSIWKCTVVIDTTTSEMVLNCVKVYTEPKNRAKCLAYPNTLVSTGFSVYYMGSDGIYEFNSYLAEPDRVGWIHSATTIIFKDAATRIDKEACNSPIAEYVPGVNADATAGDGEVHVSWPTYNPDADIVSGGSGEVDCADYVPTPRPPGDGINGYTLVANVKAKTCDYRDYGTTAMVNFTSDIEEVGGCNRQSNLMAANGVDFTLKFMDSGYGREMYLPETDTYETVGYFSQARGVFPFDKLDSEKAINRFLIEAQAIDPNDTAVLRLRLGTSFDALDPNPNPNTGKCGVIWHQLSNKPIKCLNNFTPEQYAAKNLRPFAPKMWKFEYRGIFLYYEFTLAAANNTAPTTAGCTFSRIEVDARLV